MCEVEEKEINVEDDFPLLSWRKLEKHWAEVGVGGSTTILSTLVLPLVTEVTACQTGHVSELWHQRGFF